MTSKRHCLSIQVKKSLLFYKLDDAFSKERCNKMKQSHISDFFHNDNNDSICGGEGFSGNFG